MLIHKSGMDSGHSANIVIKEKMDTSRFSGLESWYHDNFTEGYFSRNGDRKLRYALQHSDDTKGCIVVVPGRTEFIEKYLEVCRDLQGTGFSFCLLDHYGQGGSDRPLGDRQKGHVDDFQIYVDDLRFFLVEKIGAAGSRNTVLLSHSMGGTIGILLASEYPELVSGMILVSPMLQINTGFFLPPLLAEVVSKTACLLGKAESYVPGGKKFDPDLEFKGNNLTGDIERFTHNIGYMVDHEELALGGPTIGWLCQAYRAMRQARRKSGEISCPVLVLEAGKDEVVGRTAMETFCKKNQQCSLVAYEDARHELLMERDFIRNEVLAQISLFLERW